MFLFVSAGMVLLTLTLKAWVIQLLICCIVLCTGYFNYECTRTGIKNSEQLKLEFCSHVVGVLFFVSTINVTKLLILKSNIHATFN